MPNVVLSNVSKCRINGQRFAIRKGDCAVMRGKYDTNNSESGDFEEAAVGRRKFTFSVDFQKDPAVQEHAAPLNIARDDTVHFELFPTGIDEDPYDCPTAIISEFHVMVSADTGEPVSGRIVGESTGVFTMPNES